MPYRLILEEGVPPIECDTVQELMHLVGSQEIAPLMRPLVRDPQAGVLVERPAGPRRMVPPPLEPPPVAGQHRHFRLEAIVDVMQKFGRMCHRSEVMRALQRDDDKVFQLDLRSLETAGRVRRLSHPRGFLELVTAMGQPA